jgi:hypothetical protein
MMIFIWDDWHGNVLLILRIENESIDNKIYILIWKDNDDDYRNRIDYELNDGILEIKILSLQEPTDISGIFVY